MNLTPLLEQILCVVSVMLNTHIVNHKIVVLKTYYLFTLNADTFIVLAPYSLRVKAFSLLNCYKKCAWARFYM